MRSLQTFVDTLQCAFYLQVNAIIDPGVQAMVVETISTSLLHVQTIAICCYPAQWDAVCCPYDDSKDELFVFEWTSFVLPDSSTPLDRGVVSTYERLLLNSSTEESREVSICRVQLVGAHHNRELNSDIVVQNQLDITYKQFQFGISSS